MSAWGQFPGHDAEGWNPRRAWWSFLVEKAEIRILSTRSSWNLWDRTAERLEPYKERTPEVFVGVPCQWTGLNVPIQAYQIEAGRRRRVQPKTRGEAVQTLSWFYP